jgi:hypothetical protein
MGPVLVADPARTHLHGTTGIYVSAQSTNGVWTNLDIAELDKDSLQQWLRSRGGVNTWAESVVYHLLGHHDG